MMVYYHIIILKEMFLLLSIVLHCEIERVHVETHMLLQCTSCDEWIDRNWRPPDSGYLFSASFVLTYVVLV